MLPALFVFFTLMALALAADLALALWSGEISVFTKNAPVKRVLRAQDAGAYWGAVAVRGAIALVVAFTAGLLGNLRAKARAGKPTLLDHLQRR